MSLFSISVISPLEHMYIEINPGSSSLKCSLRASLQIKNNGQRVSLSTIMPTSARSSFERMTRLQILRQSLGCLF